MFFQFNLLVVFHEGDGKEEVILETNLTFSILSMYPSRTAFLNLNSVDIGQRNVYWGVRVTRVLSCALQDD